MVRNQHDFNTIKNPAYLISINAAHQPAISLFFSPCFSSHYRSVQSLYTFPLFFTAWFKPCSHKNTLFSHFQKFTILLHSMTSLFHHLLLKDAHYLQKNSLMFSPEISPISQYILCI